MSLAAAAQADPRAAAAAKSAQAGTKPRSGVVAPIAPVAAVPTTEPGTAPFAPGVPWIARPKISAISIGALDAKGARTPLPWATRAAPIWTDEVPQFRLWIEVPKAESEPTVSLTPGKAPGYTLTSVPKDSPFPSTSRAIALNLSAGVELAPLSFKSRKVSIVPDVAHPNYFLSASCANLGVRVVTSKEGGKFLYAGAACAAGGSDNTVQVRLFHSEDANWAKVPTGPGSKKLPDGSLQLEIPRPPRGSKGPGPSTIATLQGKSSQLATEIAIQASALTPVQRAGIVVGLSGTQIRYTEPGQGIKLNETALTAKITGFYLIKPNLFDVGVNAFITVLPILHSPSSVSAARFYGSNIRLGWTLPFRPFGISVGVSGGAYFWGMLVSDSSYGISFLSGPQAFLLLRKNWSLYLKVAPISAGGFSFSGLGNREIAVGLAYPISKAGAKRPFSLTLDVADTAFDNGDGINSLKLTNASLGVQMGL